MVARVVLGMSGESKPIVAASVWGIHEDQTWSGQTKWMWSYRAWRWGRAANHQSPCTCGHCQMALCCWYK